MSNPLVADVKDSTQSFSGVPLLESVNDTSKAIQSGDWAGGVMGVVGTAMDAASMAMDPFGAILAAGVGWLMEHVGPLKEALDALAGDPDEIKAHSETWKNIATELGQISTDLGQLVTSDTQSWTGPGGDAYRARGADTANLVAVAQSAAEGASSGIGTAGEVVSAVRTLVRDIIAELVGHLISWALQVLFTLGIGMAWVVPQVVAAVTKTAAKIAKITTELVQALKKLVPMLTKLGKSFDDSAKELKNIKSSKPEAPKSINDRPRGGDGSTTASGAGGGSQKGPDGGTGPNSSRGIGNGDGSTTTSGAGSSSRGDVDAPPTSNGSTKSSGSDDGGGSGTPPPKADDGAGSTTSTTNKPGNARDSAVGVDNRVCESDPVDVATGEVVMSQIDLTIAGSPDLVLERTHISSYRAGRWFGRSWTSTLDQRLEIDDENVCYFSADGMIMVYPIPPENGLFVLPVEGPRWPLVREADTYVVHDVAGARTLRFPVVAGASTHPLAVIEHAGGARVEIEYDVKGAPVSLRHSAGHGVGFRTEAGRITELRMLGEPDVVIARYRYDDRRRLTGVINSSGSALRFDYDHEGRLTGWQDRNEVFYRYVYDADGRCVRTVGDRGFLDGTFEYDRDRRVTTHTNSLGHRTEYHFNELNQVVAEIDPLGQRTGFEWDRYDRLLSRTDPLGRVTAYEYDAAGNVIVQIRPDGSRVTFDPGDAGSPGAATVGDGARTLQQVYPAGEAPDPATEQLGSTRPASYESLVPAADPDVAPEPGSHVERDLFGRPVAVVDAAGNRTTLGWTVEGRRRLLTGPLGGRQLWRHDPEGNEIEQVDAAGRVTRTAYGPFDLPVAVTDPAGGVTRYAYDTELRLVSVTNPNGLVWSYAYDAAGRLVSETDYDGRTLRFEHDAAGRVVRAVNGAGELTEYTYDLLDQVVERRTAAGLTTYTYDPLGRLLSATAPDTRLTRTYDDEGRLLSETVDGRTVTFVYSADGTRRLRRTPSGAQSEWTFDADGVPVRLRVAGHEMALEHDTGGREVRRSIDGAPLLTQSFDAERRLTAQEVTDRTGRTMWRRHWERLPDGTPSGYQDSFSGQVRLALDQAGRIIEVTAPDRRESYQYDAAGNLAAATVRRPGKSPEPADGPLRYHRNTVTAAGGTHIAHDPQGRLVMRRVGVRTWQFGWDAHDRLTSVSTPDGSRWQYRYDPLGRRIAKFRQVAGSDGAPVTMERFEFSWDGPLLVEQVHIGADGVRRVTTWDHHPVDDRPMTQVRDGVLAVVVTDAVGTPTAVFDAAGAPLWHDRSPLWGREADSVTPLRFPGQYADLETGLHYNVFRYYDPTTGRYASQDPFGLGPGPNPAGYVPNPLRTADPLGLMECGAGNGGQTPNRGTGVDPAAVKKAPPPPPKPKPYHLQDHGPVPDNGPRRGGAQTFGKNNAANEAYELSEDGKKVRIYRFGDQSKPYDWESKNRWNNNHQGFTQPNDLNSWAIKQSSFGSGSENAGKNPLISVATDPASLSKSNDPWVQKIVNESPDLRVMEVPAEALIRPRPTKPISKEETEWMFYDGDASMDKFHVEWRPNPFKTT